VIYIELKDCRSIYQFKEHHLILKLIIACMKSCFSFIALANLNAMINVHNNFVNLYLQIHHASLVEYMIVQICIQFNKILLKICNALINSLLCSLESIFYLKVANFRITKSSMQVFNVILSVEYLIMIMHAYHMISSLIARLLWQVWCKSLQLLFFRDKIRWHCNYEVFTILQSEHQEIVVCNALLSKLARSISMLTCITLIVIITILMSMIRDWSSLLLKFWYVKLQDKQYVLHLQIL